MRRVLQPFLRLETAARRFKTSGSGPVRERFPPFYANISCSNFSTFETKPQSFVDRVRVHVRAGSGGQGAARLGAAGGDGGDVLVVADSSVHSLAALQQAQRIRAGPGMPGARRAHSVKGEGREGHGRCISSLTG